MTTTYTPAVLYTIDGEVAVLDDCDDPTAAPSTGIAYVLDYATLPQAGITHAETWRLWAYPPGSPDDDLVDYMSLTAAHDYDAARAWAIKVVADRDEDLVAGYVRAGYDELDAS